MASTKKTHLDGKESDLAFGAAFVATIHLRQLEHIVRSAESMMEEIEEQELVESIHGDLKRYRSSK